MGWRCPSSQEWRGAGHGVQARLWDLAGAWGLRADAPVGEVGVDKPPSSLATEERCCALCAAAGARGHGPCGGSFLLRRVPPRPAKKCPQTHWATAPTATLSLSPKGATGQEPGPEGSCCLARCPWSEASGDSHTALLLPGGPTCTRGRVLAATAATGACGVHGCAELPGGLSLEAACAGRPPSPVTGHHPRGPAWEGQMRPAHRCLQPSCSRLAQVGAGPCHWAPGRCRFKDHAPMCRPAGAAGQRVRPALTGVRGCVWGRALGQVSVRRVASLPAVAITVGRTPAEGHLHVRSLRLTCALVFLPWSWKRSCGVPSRSFQFYRSLWNLGFPRGGLCCHPRCPLLGCLLSLALCSPRDAFEPSCRFLGETRRDVWIGFMDLFVED